MAAVIDRRRNDMRRHRTKIALGIVTLIAVAVSGAAIAATGALSPKQENQAVLNDAAEQLGIEPSQLSAALKEALSNRVDAAVAAGRLTEAEGAALKERIASGAVPLFGPGGPGPGHRGHLGELETAASYLGMTQANLRTALAGGRTLAEVARDRGKSVDGLIDAMTNAATKRLNQAVAAGRLTDAERDAMLSGLRQRITDHVNGVHRPRFGRGGPPILRSSLVVS
jgi:hypothetical protein